MNDAQKTLLYADAYRAQKMSKGASDGFRGNQYCPNVVNHQNDGLPKFKDTASKIASDVGVGAMTIIRAEQFAQGLDAAEAASPGIREAVLSGEIKAPKSVIAEIRNLPPKSRGYRTNIL